MTGPGLTVVASSPTQVLHALELLHAEPGDTALVVLRPSEPVAAAQVDRLLGHVPGHVDLDQVELCTVADKLRWLRRAVPAHRGRRLALGDYRLDLLRELARRVAAPEVLLLDDGNATVLIGEARWRGADPATARYGRAGRTLRHRLHRLAGVAGPEPRRVTYFTIYDLVVPPTDRVRRHRYGWLRATYPDVEPDGSVVFLGSSAVESDILGRDVYLDLVGRAMGAPTPPTRYLAHRREDPAKLADLARRFGLDVATSPTPVEHALRAAGRHPALAWCLPSSVADTLPVAFDGRIRLEVLVPPASVVRPADRATLDTLAHHLRATADPATTSIEVAGA